MYQSKDHCVNGINSVRMAGESCCRGETEGYIEIHASREREA
jgi:hypothetical protein